MGHAIAPVAHASMGARHPDPPKTARHTPPPEFRFHNLVLSEPPSIRRGRTATLVVSLVVHTVLLVAIIILPLLAYDYLPAPGEAIRAFFVTPPDVAPPPPPPPPPPAGVRVKARTPVAPQPVEPKAFVAPVEVPAAVVPEVALDTGGVEGGVAGGVEGGVPGGVVGGIVGGLPAEAPPPPKVVRIGGQLIAPKLLNKVTPEYPELAKAARLQAIIILEAWVGLDGRVKSVKVLRGAPLFDEPALAAVQQWRYKPLLLNGQPSEFVLTVTLQFHINGVS